MKKGEVSTSFLASMILLLLGFAVILSAYFIFDWGGTVDSETCHSSVVLRGTVPEIAKSYTPLKCQTEKICITNDGLFSSGSCEDVFSGVDKVTKIKISSDVFSSDGKTDAKTQIERAISQEVIDCWTMMGKGRISISNTNLANSFGIGETEPFCVICSRISVDSSLKEEFGDTNLVNVNPFEYMSSHKITDGEISYLDFITTSGVGGKGASFSFSKENVFNNFDSSTLQDYSSVSNEDKFEQLAIIYTQAYAPDSADVWQTYLNTFFIAEIGAYSVAPNAMNWLNTLTVKTAFSNPWTTGLTAAALLIAGGYVELNTLNNQALTASYCGDITSTNSKTSKGCSIVRVVPYNSEELNLYCGVIDGIS